MDQLTETKVHMYNKSLDGLKLNGYPVNWEHPKTKRALSHFIHRVNHDDVMGEVNPEKRCKESVGALNAKRIGIRLTSANLSTIKNQLIVTYIPYGPMGDYVGDKIKLNFRTLAKLESGKVVIDKIITMDVTGV